MDFREKVFNDYYIITEKNIEALKQILGTSYNENDQICTMFEHNLREAEKTKFLFERILKFFEKKNKNIGDYGFTNTIILTACLLAVRISFLDEDNLDLKTDSYEYLFLIDKFGNKVGKGIAYYKKKYKELINVPQYWDLVGACTFLYMFMDEEMFGSFFFTEQTSSESLLNKEFFYLSDENKSKYCKQFKKECSEGCFSYNNAFERSLTSVICFKDLSKDINFINSVFNIYLKSNSLDKIKDLEFCVKSYSEIDKDKPGFLFVEKISKKLKIYLDAEQKKKFHDAFETKDYSAMIQFLHEYENNEERRTHLISLLKHKSYYFPYLGSDINVDQWRYCHAVCDFLARFNEREDFIKFAIKQCAKEKSNKCLHDRYYALIKYKIDATFEKSRFLGK